MSKPNMLLAQLFQGAMSILLLAACPHWCKYHLLSLYRALTNLAENKLSEPFLFIPNLQGPVYLSGLPDDPAHGLELAQLYHHGWRRASAGLERHGDILSYSTDFICIADDLPKSVNTGAGSQQAHDGARGNLTGYTQ